MRANYPTVMKIMATSSLILPHLLTSTPLISCSADTRIIFIHSFAERQIHISCNYIVIAVDWPYIFFSYNTMKGNLLISPHYVTELKL